jgi:carboxymethylenebutenolidase
MAQQFREALSEAIAPSMYDRLAQGFVAQPDDSASGLSRGCELALANRTARFMNDIRAVFDSRTAGGDVFITGCCYGGCISSLAASRVNGLRAASCFCGGQIQQMLSHRPDTNIPLIVTPSLS